MKKLCFLFLAAFQTLAVGQEVPMVQIRTLCFQQSADAPAKLVVKKPDGALIKIELSESFPTERTRVPMVDGKITFFAEGKLDEPAAVASVPGSTRDLLILLVAAPPAKKPLVFDCVPMSLSKSDFPDDGALLMNAYSKDVGIKMGEQKLLLKPGMRTTIQRPKERNDYNMAALQVHFQEEEKWKIATETALKFPEGVRQLFITFSDPQTKRVTFKVFQIREL